MLRPIGLAPAAFAPSTASTSLLSRSSNDPLAHRLSSRLLSRCAEAGVYGLSLWLAHQHGLHAVHLVSVPLLIRALASLNWGIEGSLVRDSDVKITKRWAPDGSLLEEETQTTEGLRIDFRGGAMPHHHNSKARH